jgi:hypothetical protein
MFLINSSVVSDSGTYHVIFTLRRERGLPHGPVLCLSHFSYDLGNLYDQQLLFEHVATMRTEGIVGTRCYSTVETDGIVETGNNEPS